MKTIIFAEHVTVPESVHNHDSFRSWISSGDVPERARISYLDGDLWVDIPMERIQHNQCKKAFSHRLTGLIEEAESGLDFPDGMLLSNLDAGLSTQPEFMFVATETLESGLVTILRGDDSVEVIGSPDMTLEVISTTSVEKDTILLRRLYWEAGVKEYWLADSRENHFAFDILRRGSTKFVATRKSQGWMKSKVFGREFKLTREEAKHGISKFVLEMR